MGLSWKKIMEYQDMITYIAKKYSNDPDLAEDVAQEVMLKLHEDKNLKLSSFDPAKLDAGLRNTIRNKVLTVLGSRKTGRWNVDSIDDLVARGYQFDGDGKMVRNPDFDRFKVEIEDGRYKDEEDR